LLSGIKMAEKKKYIKMNKAIHVNEIKFEGETPWIKQFNLCSDYWQKYTDESLSEDEREVYGRKWQNARYELESGAHNDNR